MTWATTSKIFVTLALVMAIVSYCKSDTVGMLYAVVYAIAAGVVTLYDEE